MCVYYWGIGEEKIDFISVLLLLLFLGGICFEKINVETFCTSFYKSSHARLICNELEHRKLRATAEFVCHA